MSKEKKNKESIYDAIYDVVRCVPKGRVTSYGAVAAAIGAAVVRRPVAASVGAAGLLPGIARGTALHCRSLSSAGRDGHADSDAGNEAGEPGRQSHVQSSRVLRSGRAWEMSLALLVG